MATMTFKAVYDLKNVPKNLDKVAVDFHMWVYNAFCHKVNPLIESWNKEYEFEFGKASNDIDHYNRWFAAREESIAREFDGPFMTFTVDPVDVILIGHLVGHEGSSISFHLEEM